MALAQLRGFGHKVRMNIRHLPVFVLMALSACAAPPPPPAPQPAPAPKPVPVTPPPLQKPAGEWIDWPLSAGDWVYRQDERGSIALFGPAGQNATLTLRCDTARRRVYLARAGSGTAGRMVIRTNSTLKEFNVSPTGATPAYLAADIMPNDPILDAIALSRGRFAIEVDGQTPVAIPTWAEITRIVEDCRG
jgi:hypothetical protein